MANAGLLPSALCGTRSTMGSCSWLAPPVATSIITLAPPVTSG